MCSSYSRQKIMAIFSVCKKEYIDFSYLSRFFHGKWWAHKKAIEFSNSVRFCFHWPSYLTELRQNERFLTPRTHLECRNSRFPFDSVSCDIGNQWHLLPLLLFTIKKLWSFRRENIQFYNRCRRNGINIYRGWNGCETCLWQAFV